jgi:hypothetical protein
MIISGRKKGQKDTELVRAGHANMIEREEQKKFPRRKFDFLTGHFRPTKVTSRLISTISCNSSENVM